MIRASILASCVALLVLSAAPAAGAQSINKDRVTRYTNATVFGTSERSFLVRGHEILRGAARDVAKADRTVDLAGGFVVPGLVDGHGHLKSLGRALARIDLRGSASWAEVVERTRKGADPGAGWVFGRGWDQNRWPSAAFPTHAQLSTAFPGRPVVLKRVDGHVLVVNATVLRLAGIDATTPDPEGGRILRDAAGAPTGVLVDNAMALVNRVIPEPDDAQLRVWLKRAFVACLEVGLTGMHDMGMDAATIAVLQSMDGAGQLPLRVTAYTDGVIPGQKPYYGTRFSVVGTKLFADGALGSRGAALLHPYDDEPDHKGLLLSSPESLKTQACAARAVGLQPAIHAIGDRGVRSALDALKACPGKLPGRVEHAQVVHPDDFARFAAENVIASMQPTHATSDMPWAESRLGAGRIQGSYAWQTMLRARVPLVFGSDFPVESHDPRKGLFAAITRQTESGQPAGGWRPEQSVTLDLALRAFSIHAARAIGQRQQVADFTVFDRDLRAVKPLELLKIRVVRVVVGGQQVYP
ncbi:MAG: putative amidohydrolase YtcJ [Myxococcota bacterium]|jgi:predicted amidohydrolase YtcJ